MDNDADRNDQADEDGNLVDQNDDNEEEVNRDEGEDDDDSANNDDLIDADAAANNNDILDGGVAAESLKHKQLAEYPMVRVDFLSPR